MFFGIDLTSSHLIPSACVSLDRELNITFHEYKDTDDDIVGAVVLKSPRIVAIDAPLALPSGLCCLEESCSCQTSAPIKGRWCERELARLGMPCYFTTKKSIIKKMVYRGVGLKNRLEREGFKVIEVYPYASKVRLFGKPVPPKSTSEGLRWLKDKLGKLLGGPSTYVDRWDHNMCDAALAAYTAFLYTQGMTEEIGKAEDGFISIPRLLSEVRLLTGCNQR